MIVCPFCGHENIEGMDVCQQCEHSLTDLYLSEPATEVERGLLRDHVSVLKPKSPVVVSPDDSVADVLKTLVERRIGCVLVVKDKAIVGIFSERDALLKLNAEAGSLADRPVSEFMTTNVETLDSKAKVAFAVQRMDLGSYRHVPIVDEAGGPNGIISARDILRYVTELSAKDA